MRRASLLLGTGLAIGLALPAAAQTHGRYVSAPAVQTTHAGHLPAGHLCPECAAALPKRVPAGTMTAAQAAEMVAQGCVNCDIPGDDHAPGLAMVGGGYDAAGYASIGMGTGPMAVASAEPMPIGVMRTSYPSPALPVPAAAPAYIPPPPTPVDGSSVDKGRMFSRMIGLPVPRLGGLGRAAAARRREAHAAVRYDGLPGDAGSLPASAVYGRGGH